MIDLHNRSVQFQNGDGQFVPNRVLYNGMIEELRSADIG